MNELTTTKTPAEPKLTLKPARLELNSAKVQAVLAALATISICIYCFAPALHVGFLLDDFLHLDYLSRALNGDWGDFVHNFYGNWANSPVMVSYRPLVSLSLFIDYLIWGANAFGFHLSNLLMLWGCALFVALISLELTGLKGNRLEGCAAVWTAVLFAIYPLHLESAAWVIGRVDLLCTLFYLISVFCYLRFRLLHETYLFHLSLVSFVLAMLSKEMAVTLPIVISAAEILLFPLWQEKVAPEFKAGLNTRRLTGVFSYWFIMGFLIVGRMLFLHQLVGGYGESGLRAMKNFLNRDPIERILFPVNIDLLARTGLWEAKEQLVKVLKAAYLAVLACGAVRILMKSASLRILAFLVIWAVVSVLPTYQIWLISPNLVGSRLFFLSSAPCVILLVFLALPCIDIVRARFARIFSIVGALALCLIVGIWSTWLQFDMRAWTGAAEELHSFRKQLLEKLQQVDNGKSILVLNLPADYSGAGLISRGDYLKYLLRPPLTKKDLSSRVIVLESPGNNEKFDYCTALNALLKDRSIAETVAWTKDKTPGGAGEFVKWQAPVSASSARSFNFHENNCGVVSAPGFDLEKIDLQSLVAVANDGGREWKLEEIGGRRIQKVSGNTLKVRPGNQDLLIVFASEPVSPLTVKEARVRYEMVHGKLPLLNFLWSEDSPVSAAGDLNKAGNLHKQRFFQSPLRAESHFLKAELCLEKSWATARNPSLIALHLPKGDYELELSQFELQ